MNEEVVIEHGGERLVLKMGGLKSSGSTKLVFDGPRSFTVVRKELIENAETAVAG